MKADLILTADWHLRDTIPKCRTDDFWKAQWRKLLFIKELQQQQKCSVFLAGDFFHHWKASPYLLSQTMTFIPDQLYTIYGQHDLPQHSMQENFRSGLYTMQQSEKIQLLKEAHFGQEPRTSSWVLKTDKESRKILVWHRMIWQGKRPWPGCTDPSAIAVLKKYPHDLILTGDNHKTFVETYDNRILVNPGSLTRQSADQIDHRPKVFLYFAATNTVEEVAIPFEQGVVSRAHIKKDEERSDRIEAFISKLGGEWDATLSFEANLEIFLQTNPTLESVKKIIYDAIE